MRALVQRVSRAQVTVDGATAGEIGRGFLVLLGVGDGDTDAQAKAVAAKVAGLRIFEDSDGKMNLGLEDVGGAVLCVSQFTLYGDVRKGRRPSFGAAADPATGERLYGHVCSEIERLGLRCERGVFGARMEVELVNDGPVTLWIDTEELARPRR
jgi:D-tyrosyl-tRNA(Tyr) deacylase